MEKVRVRIRCSQRLDYAETVEMTAEEWTKLKATPAHEMEDENHSPLGNFVSATDPLAYGEFDDIEMQVIDKDGNAVLPLDCYEGD